MKTYKGYMIEEFHGKYTVTYCGDEVIFHTEAEARDFIDVIDANPDKEITEDGDQIYTNIDGETAHMITYTDGTAATIMYGLIGNWNNADQADYILRRNGYIQ